MPTGGRRRGQAAPQGAGTAGSARSHRRGASTRLCRQRCGEELGHLHGEGSSSFGDRREPRAAARKANGAGSRGRHRAPVPAPPPTADVRCRRASPNFFLLYSALDQSLHVALPSVAWRRPARPPRKAAPSLTNPPKHSSRLDGRGHTCVPPPRALRMCGHFHCRGQNTRHPGLAARTPWARAGR